MYHCQNPEEYTSIVDGVVKDSQKAVIYDMQGREISLQQKGMNIIRSNDGKTKICIMK